MDLRGGTRAYVTAAGSFHALTTSLVVLHSQPVTSATGTWSLRTRICFLGSQEGAALCK